MFWQTTRFRIDLSRPRVMGIVNVTPDSFSDGGLHADVQGALAHCERLITAGVDILDIGGESTRPGAEVLAPEIEWQRLAPVLAEAVKLGVPVSVDTCKAEVMRRALDLGVDIINDVHALTEQGCEQAVAAHPSCGLCLMHMRGDPGTMQSQTHYDDVVAEVREFLMARLGALRGMGIVDERVTLDPGIGFGKTPAQNLALLQRQGELLMLQRPLLVGWSRKSTLGAVTGRPVEERLPASLAAALASVAQGARVVRVHDVAATVDALAVWQAAGGALGPAR